MAKEKGLNVKTADRKTASKSTKAYEALENAANKKRQQGTASPEEQARRINEGRTQGRKGCKTPRICLAVSDDNLQYIRTMGKCLGMTNAQFIGYLITQRRKDYPEEYEKAQEVINSFFGKGTEEPEGKAGPDPQPFGAAQTTMEEVIQRGTIEPEQADSGKEK